MIHPSSYFKSEIPSDWRLAPFWTLFKRNKKTGFPNEELLSVYRDYGVIPKSSRDDNHNVASEDLSGYQLVTEGSLVTNKMKAWQGSIAISRHQGIVSPAYYVYEPLSKEHDQYLHYLFRSRPYIALYQRISKGVRVGQWDLEHEALRTIPVLLPDLSVQKDIADFLDRETARIDQLIEKKNEYLSLSLERQKNTVSHAISSGLAAAQQKKETGYYWLPKIPAHWHMYPLKALIWFQEGPGILAKDFYDDGIPLLRIKGLGGKYATLKGCNFLNPVDAQTKWHHFRLDKGDLLISGSATTSGIVAEVGSDTEGSIAYTGIIRIKTKPNGLCRELIPYFLMSRQFDEQIISLSAGSTIQHFGPSHLSRMKAPLAPLTEQRQIASYLDKTLETQRQVSNSVRKSINLLQEYRTALITAAVTGQIDVKSYCKSGAVDRHLDHLQDEGRA